MDVTRRITRRALLRSTVLAVAGAAMASGVAACTPSAPATEQKEKPTTAGPAPVEAPPSVEIRISAWGDVTDKQVYENIVADFAEVEPGIKATVEQYPGGYYDKIQANFAAGTSADILYFQGWSWQPFADKDQMLPLDEFISKDGYKEGWPDIQNYTDNTVWYGKKYMSVADTGSVVMFYAKELFDEAGVPYPTDDWAYADFQNAVEKTTREEGGVKYYGYAQAGDWNGTYLRSIHWMRMEGALEWDRIVEPKRAQWLDERIISALQYTVVDTIAKGQCPSPATIQGGGVTIATGRVAMTMEGPWFLAQMQGSDSAKEGGVAFDVVEPPTGATGTDETIAEVHGHVIAESSGVSEAAWALVKYIMTDEGQKRIAEGGRMCGTPDAIEEHWVPIAQDKYNFTNGKAFANAMRTGRNPVFAGAGANYDAIAGPSTPLAVAWDAMLNGTSAEEALTIAQPALQKILDDYWTKKG